MTDAPIDILSPKNDFVFKQLFGDAKRTAPLEALLQATLGLPAEEFVGLTIVDPHLNRRYKGDKRYVLDVRITTRSGRDIDVEIQVRPSEELKDRILGYAARMVAEKVKAGGGYKVSQSISIVITDHPLWEEDTNRYHHRFCLFDPEAGIAYPNSLEIHTLELPKIQKTRDGTTLWRWLKFISSKTRREFESVARKDKVMTEALMKLLDMSVDQPTRRRAEARAKWLWDEEARMRQSRREGREEGEVIGRREGEVIGRREGEAKGRQEERNEFILRLLQMNMPHADVAKAAKCSIAEIKRLERSSTGME